MQCDGINKSVSRTSVHTVIACLNPITNIVKKQGQGNDNQETWRKARYNWVLHFLVRLDETHNHPSLKKHLEKFKTLHLPDWLDREKLKKGGYTFSKYQICWYDECHVYQELGPSSKTQFQFKWINRKPVKNECDDYSDLNCDKLVPPPVPVNQDKEGENDDEDDEGKEDEQDSDDPYLLMRHQKWHLSNDDVSKFYRNKDYIPTFKFQQQACFMFGVSLILTLSGLAEGIRLPMMTYTGKKFLEWENGMQG